MIRSPFVPTRKNTTPPHQEFTETVDAAHGRLEVRRYWPAEKLDWFADRAAWEGLQSVTLQPEVALAGT